MKPPKDRTFLADISLPFYVLSYWNAVNNEYAYANLQIDLFDGKWQDSYFDTEYFKEEELINWIEVPKIKEME